MRLWYPDNLCHWSHVIISLFKHDLFSEDLQSHTATNVSPHSYIIYSPQPLTLEVVLIGIPNLVILLDKTM